MFDLYNLLVTLENEFGRVLLITILCTISVGVVLWKQAFQNPGWLLLIAVCGVLSLSNLRYMQIEYYLVSVGDEYEDTVHTAFDRLNSTLSDAQVKRLVKSGRKDRNERFYIALIAAERGLQISDAAMIKRPSFFWENNCTRFSKRLDYPLTYSDFLRNYQATFKRDKRISIWSDIANDTMASAPFSE